MQIIPEAQAQTQQWSTINSACVSQDGVATIQGIGCLLANVFSVFLTILGIVGFIMIIYAAFNLMVMGGNSQATEKSKNTITYAVIGIILALSAFIIINLIASFTGLEIIKDFVIPGSGKDWTTNSSIQQPSQNTNNSPIQTTTPTPTTTTKPEKVSTESDPCINNGGYCTQTVTSGSDKLKCSVYCCNGYHSESGGLKICGPAGVSADPAITVLFPNGTPCAITITSGSTLPKCTKYCRNGYHPTSTGAYECGPS